MEGSCVRPKTTVLCLQETVATKLTSRSWCREGCVCVVGFSERVDMMRNGNAERSELGLTLVPFPTPSHLPAAPHPQLRTTAAEA